VALEEYKRKRDFKKTPEPSGDEPAARAKSGELFFCVQKHLASHLHYDFRLEWKGVLLSWAVPKGPSLNPADKRLAMQTEDHPFDYGMFEGVIPEGYGAGIVMLWDYGTWEPESEDVDAALRKGDLKLQAEGIVGDRQDPRLPVGGLRAKRRRAEQLAVDQTPGRLVRPNRHHGVCAAQRQDAERGFRGDPPGQDPRSVAEQRAGQSRRHRGDVQEDHRARVVDEGGEEEDPGQGPGRQAEGEGRAENGAA
jgi:DNA ligase D-like protein (predicted 3'-phosphoesterase)